MLRRALPIVIALWLAPSGASACSPGCGLDVEPHGTESAPAHLPANGVFVVLRPGPYGLGDELRIVRTRAGATETSTMPPSDQPIQLTDVMAGDRLQITYVGHCSSLAEPTDVVTWIDVTPEAPIPTTLGELVVAPSRLADVAVWDNRGGCSSPLASSVASYEVVLDPAAVPWADALLRQPMLDGASWNETVDATVAPHFVFAHCAALLPSQTAYDTIPGAHRLRVEATLRGRGAVLTTNEESFELTCGGTGAGCAARPSDTSGAPWTIGVVLAALVLARLRRRTRLAMTMLLAGCATTHAPDGTDGGTDASVVIADAGHDASVEPSQIGQVATSCGAADQGLTPIDCTAHGDTMAFCVFGNHCSCSDGFACERPGFVDPECDAGASCVPAP